MNAWKNTVEHCKDKQAAKPVSKITSNQSGAVLIENTLLTGIAAALLVTLVSLGATLESNYTSAAKALHSEYLKPDFGTPGININDPMPQGDQGNQPTKPGDQGRGSRGNGSAQAVSSALIESAGGTGI